MRFTVRFLSSVLLVFFFCAQGKSQSWCANAKTDVERTICGDASLSQLDEHLAQIFNQIRAVVGDPKTVIKEQRGFLKRRTACGTDALCLAREYDKQIGAYLQLARQASIDLPETSDTPKSGHAQNEQSATTSVDDGQEIKLAAVTVNYGELGGAGNAMDALIVANADYAELEDLKTPSADAALVSSALASRGIKTKVISNASRTELDAALADFKDSPRKDVFILYYAGHAANIGGNSSLIFPNFKIAEGTSNGEYEAISDITKFISKLGYKKALIVFDACRNIVDIDDPAVAPTVVAQYQNTRSVKALGSRSLELAALQGMEYAISFSSAEGQTALDTVNGKNSPFAQAFAFNVRDKRTFFDAIIETRRTVRQLTDDRQRPTLEMSWDEDLALSSNLIKSVTYRFLEPFDVVVGRPSGEVQLDNGYGSSASTYQLSYKTTENDGCALNVPTPGSATFTFSSFDCLAKVFHMSVRQNPLTGTSVSFPTFSTREQDGSYGRCEDATFVLDLDADGRPETATFGSNKYGGYLQFKRDGHTASYYSQLGCSFSELTAYDLDKDGVADLIISYACGDDMECLAVLSGERLVSNVDGDYASGDDRRFEKYFKKSEYLGILGGLNRIALYYDQNIKYIREISPSGLKFTCYKKSWEDIPDNYMPNKELTIDRDGSINVVSDDQQFRISPFQSPGLIVNRLR